MLFFAGGIEELPNAEAASAEYTTWRNDTIGANDLLDHFASSRKVNRNDLKKYVDELTSPIAPGSIQKDIVDAFHILEDRTQDPEDRSEAEQKLNRLCAFIPSRNALVKNTQQNLKGLKASQQELPSGIEFVKDNVTKTLGACVDGFSNATGQEKAVMLAGVVAAYLVIRNMWQGSKDSQFAQFAKNGVLTAGGLGLGYLALQSVNKAVEKTRGRPLIDHRLFGGKGSWTQLPSFPAVNPPYLGSVIGSDQKTWEEKQLAQTIDRAHDELQSGPKGVLEDIFAKQSISDADKPKASQENHILDGSPENKEFMRKRRGNVAGIMNLSTLSVAAFRTLYESSKDSGIIEEKASGYPHQPFKKDGLTSVERFQLVHEVGQAILLFKADGTPLSLDVKRENKNVLYLMLDF